MAAFFTVQFVDMTTVKKNCLNYPQLCALSLTCVHFLAQPPKGESTSLVDLLYPDNRAKFYHLTNVSVK